MNVIVEASNTIHAIDCSVTVNGTDNHAYSCEKFVSGRHWISTRKWKHLFQFNHDNIQLKMW